ncbi:DUF2852 domain-containing protein [Roseicella aquatilis]|uniref:DUF2852 domain-containing protein n=1 Tax=Roseicella aquatilis TaxID=2527868 RepID=A0A4R4DT88_9PROT|nr:DUF2852 domain-containing protein [Roseicella aquatilis]TCZ66039.1 DUF2852 domain-containing protein [Roseicella aquatilis]
MSGTAQPGAASPGACFPAGRGPAGWNPGAGGFDPWALAWSVPKPLLIAAVILGFAAFWPIGLALLFFALGSGRLGGRWARRRHMQQGGGDGCGWKGWRREEAPGSGNRAFDEYRQDTLRRLEEEQREFAAFLERLRVAKDKAEFDQFMAERRQRPAAPPAEEAAPRG